MRGSNKLISDNISFLRKYHKLSQEDMAERIGVSRQTIAKWENGDSIPDLENSNRIAELFNVSLDELVNYQTEEENIPIAPKGRYAFGAVVMDEEGRITLPQKARDVFKLKPGDKLMLLGDVKQGLALTKMNFFTSIFESVMGKDASDK